MDVKLQGVSDLSFHVMDAVRNLALAPLPKGEKDDPNTGIQVLCVDVPEGDHDVVIIFSPRWGEEVWLNPSNPTPV